MKPPIEMMLDKLTWVPIQRPIDRAPSDDGIPYATHKSVIEVMGHSIRCYQLNTGQRLLDFDDVSAIFGAAK